jgi:AraC-like DNA-binding protein
MSKFTEVSAPSNKHDELLGQFPLVRTDDPSAARDAKLRRYGVEITAPRSGHPFTSLNVAELPNLFLHFSSNAEQVDAQIAKNSFTSATLCLRGSISVTSNAKTVTIAEGQACVSSQGYDRQVSFKADSEALMLRIPHQMLDRCFASLAGFKPKCAIEFEPSLDTNEPHYKGFTDLLLTLAGRLDRAFSAWPQATLEQLEVACVSSLLFLGRHNLRHLLDGELNAGVPRHLRLAEHFAEANAGGDIGIDDMARAAAVSVSTLTRAFLKHRGCSPAAFLKRTRLAHARTLLESRAATTVIGVAFRCGFSNPSRFSKDYNDVFGETPTQTLRRLRVLPDTSR